MKVPPPYIKVKYWLDDKQYKTFLFQDTNASTNVNANANAEVISGSIRPDDNIGWVKKKLFYYLHKKLQLESHEHIYMWVNKKFYVTPYILGLFITNVFKSEKRVAFDYFKTCVYNYFSIHLKQEEAQFIDKVQAVALIEHLQTAKHVEPLFFKYTNDVFYEYTNYHPFKETNKTAANTSTMTVTPYDALLLESFSIQETEDGCLNITSSKATRNFYGKDSLLWQKFFPFAEDKQRDQTNTIVFINAIEKAETFVRHYPIQHEHQTGTFVNFLHLRVNETNFNKKQDLETLFESLVTSPDMPFLKYKAINNNYYKVYKKSIPSIKSELTGKWTESKLNQFSKTGDTSYLLVKLRYSENVYCSLLIFDSLCYDVKFTFGNMMRETTEKVTKYLGTINKVIEQVRELYPSVYVPDIDTNFAQSASNMYSSTKVLRWLTLNHIKSDKNTLNYKKFPSILTNHLFSYFNVIKNPNKNILHLQYKKIDNYLKYENIQVFITNNFVKDKEEMIRRITSEFVLSREDAEKEYDKWMAQNEFEVLKMGDKTFIKPKNDNFVNVKVRLTSSIDLTFNIEGAKSTHVHDRIVQLLVILIEMANSKSVPTTQSHAIINKADAFLYDVDTVPSPASVRVHTEMQDDLVEDLDEFVDYDEFGDLFEDDEDLLALEQEFLKAAAEEASERKHENVANAANSGNTTIDNDEDNVMKSYFMNMLKSADRDLIDYKVPKGQKLLKRYSTVCQWNDRRQPVVVTSEELQKIQQYQKNIRYVKTGSTKELQDKNFYICPQVWCPKSKMALTYKDFKEKYNESCPFPEVEEKPVLLTNHYWGKGEKGQTREHFPGFLDAKTHPRQLCLPCCFKKEAKEGTKNKQKESSCKNQWGTEQNMEEDVEVFGNEKYIKADIFVPLETSRFGLLPKAFSELLGKQVCGNGNDGKGLMNDKTNCILRKGVNQKSQSFLTAVLSILDNPEITSYATFLEHFNTHMSVERFVGLENGKIMKLFINKDFDMFLSGNFKRFVAWFMDTEQDNYVRLFGLQSIRAEFQANKDNEAVTYSKHYSSVIREFLIFNAYTHFIEYINNPQIEKNYNILIDFIQTEHTWLNINHYNIVVIEHDPITGMTNMICPFNRNAKSTLDVSDPFVFIFKQNNYYEPICHVRVKGSNVIVTHKFFLKTAPKSIRNLVQFYLQNCSPEHLPNDHFAHDIAVYIKSLGLGIRTYVIDYSFKVCGFLVSKYNLFIPLRFKTDIYDLNDVTFIYYDDLTAYRTKLPPNVIEPVVKDIFNGLYKRTGDAFYRIHSFIHSDKTQKLLGFTVGNNEYFVPINFNDGDINDIKAVSAYLEDDLNIFVGLEKKDARGLKVERDRTVKERFQNFTEKIMREIRKNAQAHTEFKFITDPQNPFPSVFKRKKLIALITPIMKDALKLYFTTDELVRFAYHYVEDILHASSANTHNVILKQLFGLKKKFKKTPFELIFDQKDIIEGRIHEKIKFIENPYTSLMDRLDRHMKDYVLDLSDTGLDELEYFVDYINTQSEYEDVPYKFRKVLNEYSLLVYKQYSPITLYDLFQRISIAKRVANISDKTLMRQVVLKQLIRDYRENNIEEFLNNPSYIFNAKAMKLKTNTIDGMVTVLESMMYYPSFYELSVLSQLARINVIVIGRKRKDNADGIEVYHNKSSRYLVLCHSYDRFSHHDLFQVVVKDARKKHPKILFRKHELSKPFVDFIEKSVRL